MTGFDLTCRPWIDVLGTDGRPRTLSLKDTIGQADRIADLDLDPLRRLAVLRLLIAIRLASDPPRDLAAMLAYLDRWRDRFDLLDPDRPFMQIPGLIGMNGRTSGLDALIADTASNDRAVMNATRTDGLTYKRAAVELLTCLIGHTGGITTGVDGDPAARHGKRYGTRAGVAIMGTLFTIRRPTLWATIDANTPTPVDGDRPVWEHDPAEPAGRTLDHAAGPAEALTRLAMHIRLIDVGGRIGDTVVTMGDRLDPTGPGDEPMYAFKPGRRPKDPPRPVVTDDRTDVIDRALADRGWREPVDGLWLTPSDRQQNSALDRLRLTRRQPDPNPGDHDRRYTALFGRYARRLGMAAGLRDGSPTLDAMADIARRQATATLMDAPPGGRIAALTRQARAMAAAAPRRARIGCATPLGWLNANGALAWTLAAIAAIDKEEP